MKTLMKTTILGLALTSGTLYASASHDHSAHGHSHAQEEVNKEQIQKVANTQLMNLIKKEKIEKSWSDTPIIDMKQKEFNHHTEWVVSYKNKEIKDTTKQTLYIFVDLYGKVTGANHTGK